MQFNKIRLGELMDLGRYHPLIATHHPKLGNSLLPPIPEDDPDFPVVFYGQEDGQLACFIRSFPDCLTFDGTSVPWAWCGNLMTFPDFRRRGLAQALVEEQLTAFDQSGHVWGGVFSAVPALRLYEKLSFTMVGMAPRLCSVRNLTPFLSHHMPGAVAKTVGALGKLTMSGVDRALRLRQRWRGKVTVSTLSPEQLETLLDQTSPESEAPAQFDMDASWVLRRRAVRNVDQIMLVRDAEDTPIGYFLVRQRANQQRPIREKYYGVVSMTVMHFGLLVDQLEAPEQILAAALDHFWPSKADIFEIVTSNEALISAAKQAGLFPLGQGMSFKFMEPGSLKGQLPKTLSSYKLTHYAGDAFGFE